jgi:hypothetical protein
MANNIETLVSTFQDIEKEIRMGYIPSSVGLVIDKFSKFLLTASTLRLASDFDNPNPFLDTPTELFIYSSSAADTGVCEIQYIDQARAMQTVTVTLTGQTPVSLGTDIYCIYRMSNTGTVDYAGDIYASSDGTPTAGVPASEATVYCKVTLLYDGITPINQSLTGVFSVPSGWTGFVTSFYVTADKGTDMSAAALARLEGGVFKYVETLKAYQSSNSKDIFKRFPEKSDFKPLAYSNSGGGGGSTGYGSLSYTVVLIENSYLDRYQR